MQKEYKNECQGTQVAIGLRKPGQSSTGTYTVTETPENDPGNQMWYVIPKGSYSWENRSHR